MNMYIYPIHIFYTYIIKYSNIQVVTPNESKKKKHRIQKANVVILDSACEAAFILCFDLHFTEDQ